jgi:hypothetical protein
MNINCTSPSISFDKKEASNTLKIQDFSLSFPLSFQRTLHSLNAG